MSPDDLEFWGHSWLRHPIPGPAPGQIVKEAACLWAPPSPNPHPGLSTSPPPGTWRAPWILRVTSPSTRYTILHANVTEPGRNPTSIYVCDVCRDCAERQWNQAPQGVSHTPAGRPGELSEAPTLHRDTGPGPERPSCQQTRTPPFAGSKQTRAEWMKRF